MKECLKRHIRKIFLLTTIIEMAVVVGYAVGMLWERQHYAATRQSYLPLMMGMFGIYKIVFTGIAVR